MGDLGGPGLSSNDTACDVQNEHRDALAGSTDDAEAEAVVPREFAEELADPEERVVVWLALGRGTPI
jgi:hypothetical protein